MISTTFSYLTGASACGREMQKKPVSEGNVFLRFSVNYTIVALECSGAINYFQDETVSKMHCLS